MLLHYLKVAVRNLLKYKMQSAISIVGLAIGFALVTLATYWNHYEKTYDAFHPNAERIHRVKMGGLGDMHFEQTDKYVKSYMEQTYPEVETACSMEYKLMKDLTCNNISIDEMHGLAITPETQVMFDFQWIEGNPNTESWKEGQIAVTDKFAEQYFKGTSAIGKRLTQKTGKECEIVGVFKAWEHSNYIFEYIQHLNLENEQDGIMAYDTYVMLRSDADAKKFNEKIESIESAKATNEISIDHIYPLKDVRWTDVSKGERNVEIAHIRLFSWASLVLTLCALLNYLTLFVSRICNQSRNMALYKVFGASNGKLFIQFMTEYLLLMLFTSMVGMLFIELSFNLFVGLSALAIERMELYGECMKLMVWNLILAVLLAILPIQYFKSKALNAHITKGRSYFRPISVGIQLTISLCFIFCSLTMYRQIQHLLECDLGIQRHKIAMTTIGGLPLTRAIQLMEQLPMIEKVMPIHTPLYPFGTGVLIISIKHGNEYNAFPVLHINDSVARFYGLKIKEGVSSFNLGKNEVIINEAMANKLSHIETPLIGKEFGYGPHKIMGIAYDYYHMPASSVSPMIFCTDIKYDKGPGNIAFTYTGDWKACETAVTNMITDEGGISPYILDGEEEYKKYLRSEMNIQKLLGYITFISILIALFGVYTLTVQSCEHRRKEIAIRKISGAKMSTILKMFFKEYLLLIITGSVIAFPIGYMLMKKWLEQYALQIRITPWMFIEIIIGITLLVVCCIYWQVWKAANENPADVVKSE